MHQDGARAVHLAQLPLQRRIPARPGVAISEHAMLHRQLSIPDVLELRAQQAVMSAWRCRICYSVAPQPLAVALYEIAHLVHIFRQSASGRWYGSAASIAVS